jgi:hypothetical protein
MDEILKKGNHENYNRNCPVLLDFWLNKEKIKKLNLIPNQVF